MSARAAEYRTGSPCQKCNQTKRYAIGGRCVACWQARSLRKYEAKPAGKRRDYELRTRYGITLQQRDDMLAAQGNRCAICRADSPGHKDWHVDHDHMTGKVRAILCCACNQGLGHFYDSPSALIESIVYLGRHGTPFIGTPVADWLRANSP